MDFHDKWDVDFLFKKSATMKLNYSPAQKAAICGGIALQKTQRMRWSRT